ncbi:uncharacterized protein LOC110260827 isoform X2 [Sus scrofa]|uniref:uncharacterized protein LOC110260827 isoform X2 n=1 Tax=Sus scrofa TaxID=9823 RepID=UPI000A2B6969|nr:uncharacterized protein LOC110260827 isoform X2 [Sus scrofa]
MMKDFKGSSHCSKIAWFVFAEWLSSFLSPACHKDAIPVIKTITVLQRLYMTFRLSLNSSSALEGVLPNYNCLWGSVNFDFGLHSQCLKHSTSELDIVIGKAMLCNFTAIYRQSLWLYPHHTCMALNRCS